VSINNPIFADEYRLIIVIWVSLVSFNYYIEVNLVNLYFTFYALDYFFDAFKCNFVAALQVIVIWQLLFRTSNIQ